VCSCVCVCVSVCMCVCACVCVYVRVRMRTCCERDWCCCVNRHNRREIGVFCEVSGCSHDVCTNECVRVCVCYMYMCVYLYVSVCILQ